MKKMKKLQVFIALALVAIISSCSKDETATPIAAPTNFDEIKMSNIQAKNSLMTNTTVKASDATGIKWENGTVLIFKTNAGLYGKFEVKAIIPSSSNYALTIKVVLFNANGSIKSTTNSIVIRGTFYSDLDIPNEAASIMQSDFYWDRPAQFDTFLVPENGAVFLKYTF
jgi:hypothetical protein